MAYLLKEDTFKVLTEASDGILLDVREETLTQIRTNAGENAYNTDANKNAPQIVAAVTTDKYTTLRRAVFSFDTSSVPAAAIISSVSFKVYINSKTTTISGQSIGVVAGASASNSTLVAADYNSQGSTRLASDQTLAGLATAAYATFSLNASGIALINKTGFTKLALELSCDIDNVNPTWSSEAEASVNVDFLEGTNKPQLIVNYAIGNTVLGLHQYLDPALTNSKLLTQVFGVVYKRNSDGSWTSIDSGRTTTLKERFVNALGYAFYTNPTDGMKTYNGTGSPGTTNAVSAPAATFIEFFKGKVYAAGTTANPDRVFFSSIPSTSLAITWDTTNNYFDMSPSDGQNISGMKRLGTELLIFKRNYLYRFYGVAGADPDAVFKVGTYSNESIVISKAGAAFHDIGGIFLYSGGQPEEISRPIKEVISGIQRSYYTSIAGWASPGPGGTASTSTADQLYWSVGTVTIEGVQFTNVVIRYTISTQVWTVYSYHDQFQFGITYDDGTSLSNVVADNNATVHTLNSGTTDNGNVIFYSLITKWFEFGSLSETTTLNQFATFADKGMGMSLSFQADNENINNWHPLGKLTKFATLFNKKPGPKGHRIRFKLHGSSSGEAWIWSGLEILSASTDALDYSFDQFPRTLPGDM